MKTIKQIADELGVSTQAIYKKINKTLKIELSSHIKQINGQRLIDEQGELIIKSSLQPLQTTIENQKSNSQENPANSENIAVANGLQPLQIVGENAQLKEQVEFLKTQIEKLQEELSKEREHSRQQAETLAELTRNSQILLKQEQEKTAFLLPEQSPTVSSETDASGMKLKQRPFWQFWKK